MAFLSFASRVVRTGGGPKRQVVVLGEFVGQARIEANG